jgi:hypothetical protein
VGVAEANFTGIPQSAVTGLSDSLNTRITKVSKSNDSVFYN